MSGRWESDLKPEFLDFTIHRFGPHFVAFLLWVESVGHDFFGEDAFSIEKGVAEVEVVDGFAVVELCDALIDGDVDKAKFVLWCLTTGKDSKKEDLSLRAAFFDEGDDLGDALGSLGRILLSVAGVIGADHDDGELGILLVLEVAILKTPDDVLGAVT